MFHRAILNDNGAARRNSRRKSVHMQPICLFDSTNSRESSGGEFRERPEKEERRLGKTTECRASHPG